MRNAGTGGGGEGEKEKKKERETEDSPSSSASSLRWPIATADTAEAAREPLLAEAGVVRMESSRMPAMGEEGLPFWGE